jgi:TolA-binding protein
MKKTAIAVLLVSLACASVTATAADKMKPGLWAMTMKSDMMKNMPKLSQEQQAQMEKMREMGIKIPQMDANGMSTNVCISKEMAERDRPPEMNHKETGCESKNFERSGSSYSVDIVCDGQNMKGTGKVKGTFSGSDSFSSTYDFKGVAHGKPVDQHMESAGKWISADCGDVAPLGAGMYGKKK